MKVEANVWSVLADGRQHEVHVDRDGADFTVTMRGRTQRVRIADPREWNANTNGRATAGLAKVASPMPGKMVRVLVAVGDRVEAGAGLAVVEAMKMQNEMKSPIAGTVTQVLTEAGATVNANQVLVVVENAS